MSIRLCALLALLNSPDFPNRTVWRLSIDSTKHLLDRKVNTCERSANGHRTAGLFHDVIVRPSATVTTTGNSDHPFEGDHYLLMGGCYYHKIMCGEAVEKWRSRDTERTKVADFDIR